MIATQNPIELEGTYRLPEAQLDRFLIRMSMGYPAADAEVDVLRRHGGEPSLDALRPVVDGAQVQQLSAQADQTYMADAVVEYVVRLCAATRAMDELRFGVSPRGALALARAARALTVVEGRDYATPDDVKRLAVAVLAHRVVLTPEAELHGQTAESLIDAALASIPVPKASVK